MSKTELSKKRHVLKTITWRIVGTMDTMLLGWILTGDAAIGVKIGMLEMVTKMFLYYFHERLWYKSDFGIKNRIYDGGHGESNDS